MTAETILSELRIAGSPEKAIHLARFFKTGPGEYGESDLFLGVTVPAQRDIARRHTDTPLPVLHTLLSSPWHEARLTALLILLQRFTRAHRDEDARRECVDFYLAHTPRINNWDLVDLTCYKLLGVWLENRDRTLLYRLAGSPSLWEQRIAIVTTMHFVRRGDFADCLAIADLLLHHPHDLIHKAVGWLLREVGKHDRPTLTAFLIPPRLHHAPHHAPLRHRTLPRNGTERVAQTRKINTSLPH